MNCNFWLVWSHVASQLTRLAQCWIYCCPDLDTLAEFRFNPAQRLDSGQVPKYSSTVPGLLLEPQILLHRILTPVRSPDTPAQCLDAFQAPDTPSHVLTRVRCPDILA
jgi:hypothetical protein